MDVDQSLEEIIKSRGSNPRGRGRGRAPRRSNPKAELIGTPAVAPLTRARAVATQKNVKTVGTTGKIFVYNFPPDVTEEQIRELFDTTVGRVKEINLMYEKGGKSKGTATVVFYRKGDAEKAYKQYDKRMIDDTRPIRIELIADVTEPDTTSLANRVGPAPTPVQVQASEVVPRSGGRPKRGRGGRRKAGNERPRKTAEDLDAEMEDYAINNAPAAAAAA